MTPKNIGPQVPHLVSRSLLQVEPQYPLIVDRLLKLLSISTWCSVVYSRLLAMGWSPSSPQWKGRPGMDCTLEMLTSRF